MTTHMAITLCVSRKAGLLHCGSGWLSEVFSAPSVCAYSNFLSPIVTAARDTPSCLATSALDIPPATISAHLAHRSGPGSRFGFDTSSSTGIRCSPRG